MEEQNPATAVVFALLVNQIDHLQQMVDLLAGQSVPDKGSHTFAADGEHPDLKGSHTFVSDSLHATLTTKIGELKAELLKGSHT